MLDEPIAEAFAASSAAAAAIAALRRARAELEVPACLRFLLRKTFGIVKLTKIINFF